MARSVVAGYCTPPVSLPQSPILHWCCGAAARASEGGALSARCPYGTFPFMERFVILLPETRRRELDALAAECGLSAADVARLGIGWVLRNPDALRGAVRRPSAQS